jgi:hypothetical protein
VFLSFYFYDNIGYFKNLSMVKFNLIIWVCSFLVSQSACMPPMEIKKIYDSWYECSRAAHHESVRMLSKLGYKYVNDNKIGTKYACLEIPMV